jgi:hypothetical protein
MADDRNPGTQGMSAADLARLKALADRRNAAQETMSDAIRKQDEARRGIIDRMR